MKKYKPLISASINRKGVLDIDSVKGCSLGMSKYPNGGCYGLCYASKMAKLYGYDFSKSVSRSIIHKKTKQLPLFSGVFINHPKTIFNVTKNHNMQWFRVGTMGDPCHDWQLTAELCEWLGCVKTPVVITKHWLAMPEDILARIKKTGAVFNTSISSLDTEDEISHRLEQFNRLKDSGIRSALRIVSCKFGNTPKGRALNRVQEKLFTNSPVIDNPLRIPQTDRRVRCGDILVKKKKDLNTWSSVSLMNNNTYIGKCGDCPDQCGVL